ncbi:cytochrome P450 [Aspergillus spectabilis]
MAIPPQNILLALATISGVTTHLALYRHGEWDVRAPKIAAIYILLLLAAMTTDLMQEPSETQATKPQFAALKAVLCHITGVYGSIIVYRALFHRLSRFPGPFLAGLSNIYVTALSARKLHLYEEVEKLHKRYSDYVRLGPTELSITNPKAIQALYSSEAKVSKGPWDKREHTRRRKVWDQGFSSRALQGYEPRVSHYTDQLINAIEQNLGSPMDDAYILKQLHADMKMIGLFSHLTWLFPFFKRIPGVNADYLKFWKWVGGRVEGRIKNFSDCPDVFSWILKAYDQGRKSNQDTLNLHGDAYLIIIDGLQERSYDKLANLNLLNAVINEALRLHPAVPSGTQRMTPPEGITISNTHIPGDVMVCVPVHSVFREPELVKDPSTFIPFNSGPYSCVGKQLALIELRQVVFEVLIQYNLSFAPGQTESTYLDGKQDTFTLVTAPLNLVFHKR